MNRTRPIDGELLRLKEEIRLHAHDLGLDFYDVNFELCDYDTINILASLGGFPNRYPHWRFGMEYDQMYKGYAYGLQKIYEMVVNTSPCYAYLLNVNNMVDQKIVMAHVYGHADFFKNNAWFKNTNRNMMDTMANHGTKIRRYMDLHGQNRVEDFVDKVLSLENLLDVDVLFQSSPTLPKKEEKEGKGAGDNSEEEETDDGRSPALKTFMNGLKRLQKKKKDKKGEGEEDLAKKIDKGGLPTRDIMRFLLDYAPLEEWESDIVGILREEAYYFLPQRMTKIMNEGWASYWHSYIMTRKIGNAADIVHFADHHAGVMQMSRKQLNPYKVGIELFRDIEYRWDTGRFGKDYTDCDDMSVKATWDKKLNLGRQKIFEIRRTHNDITFIDEFLTQEFCERQQIFTYQYNPRTGRNEIEGRDFEKIKSSLLTQLANFGSPLIEVESANYANRSELLLRHVHQGADLDLNYASETMKNIYAIWKRPINLVTKLEDKEAYFIFDGKAMRPLTNS
ncbi:MAG: SpoVR family protein [Pseudomonadota bacterium]